MVTMLIACGALLASLSPLPYVRDIMRRRARPRIISWVIWAALLAVMTYAASMEGRTASALLSGVSALSCGMIAVVGWRVGSRQIGKLDRVALIGAVISMAILVSTKDTLLALVAMVFVDALAYVPTLWNAWMTPHHESLISWSMSMVASGLIATAAILSRDGLSGLIYPLYSVSFAILMVLILLSSRWRVSRSLTEYEVPRNSVS